MKAYIFYAYRILSRMYFHVIVLFIFLYQIGFGLFNSSLLVSIYGLVLSLSGMLTGRISHRLSFKTSLIIGEFLKLAGVYLIITGTIQTSVDFMVVALGQALGGLGFGLCISRDTEIVTSDKTFTDSAKLTAILFKSQGLMFISTFVAGFVGIILYSHDEHLPFYFSIGAQLLTCFVLIFFISDNSEKTASKGAAAAEPPAVDEAANSNRILFWTCYYAVVRSLSLAPFLVFLPFYFIQLLMDPYLFAILLSLFSLFAFISALKYQRIMSTLGLNMTFLVMTGAMIVAFAIFTLTIIRPNLFTNVLYPLLLAISIFGFGSGCVRPISLENLKLGELSKASRIHVLTRMEIFFGIFNTAFIIIGATIILELGLGSLMVTICTMMVLAVLVGWHDMNRHEPLPSEAD